VTALSKLTASSTIDEKFKAYITDHPGSEFLKTQSMGNACQSETDCPNGLVCAETGDPNLPNRCTYNRNDLINLYKIPSQIV
jgi:hypothetical protein